MSNVPDVTREEITVRARHRFFLEGPFQVQKASRIHSDNGLNDLNVAKRLNDWNGFQLRPNDAFLGYLTLANQAVGSVRPENRDLGDLSSDIPVNHRLQHR
jgi:hypothetical protein